MRTFYFLIYFVAGIENYLIAQTDSTALMKEAEARLQKGSSVSEILIDKKYASLHPVTSFRELIKQYCKEEELSIVIDNIPGRKIKVIGNLKSPDGNPMADVIVYLYHTDSRGWYAADVPHVLMNEGDRRHARLFGYVKTDKDGKFELHTIKPKGYPQSSLPAHIHVEISVPGYQSVITEFLFDDDERLIGQVRENALHEHFMIAKPEKTSAPFEQQFSYIIKLIK